MPESLVGECRKNCISRALDSLNDRVFHKWKQNGHILMFNIVLIEPQIPPNTGNIGRLCVNLGAKLHLIKPFGFDISQKAVRRAGLDYWNKVDLTIWNSTEQFFKQNRVKSGFHFATKKQIIFTGIVVSTEEIFNIWSEIKELMRKI